MEYGIKHNTIRLKTDNEVKKDHSLSNTFAEEPYIYNLICAAGKKVWM
jgi:hypothetical protein